MALFKREKTPAHRLLAIQNRREHKTRRQESGDTSQDGMEGFANLGT
jgi:hypothetical protein